MGDNTKIEWTHATWNPIRGCSRVSKGCMNCYAERVAFRFKGPGEAYDGLVGAGGQWNGKIMVVADALLQPLRLKRPRLIFVNSMSALFHENVRTETIDQIFAVMCLSHWHVFQVLTKRAERMRAYCNDTQMPVRVILEAAKMLNNDEVARLRRDRPSAPPWATTAMQHLPNVWLGVSVEDQPTTARIEDLLETHAALRFLSVEPQIGRVDLCEALGLFWSQSVGRFVPVHREFNTRGVDRKGIGWIIQGGESGTGARPMHPSWPRQIRDQCAAARVPFFFKQWGAFAESIPAGSKVYPVWVNEAGCVKTAEHAVLAGGDWSGMYRVGKKNAGRLLDFVEHSEIPYFPRRVA